MKVTFIASISQRLPEDKTWQEKIVESLSRLCFSVFADHVLDYEQSLLDNMSDEDRVAFHKVIYRNIDKSDFVLGEVSNASLGVGFLLAYALSKQKPIVLMYRNRKPTNLLETLESNSTSCVFVKYGANDDLNKLVKEAIEFVKKRSEERFTMLLQSDILKHLDKIAAGKDISRSEYIRKLIRSDMRRKS